MEIRSTPPGFTAKPQADRAREAAPAASRTPAQAPGASDETPVDRVELSSEARELNARLEGTPPANALSAERLATLARRIDSGHYDRPDTIDRVLDRLLAELTRNTSQG